MDELDPVWLRKGGGNRRAKGLHLDLAVSAKTRGNAIEIAIIVARMAYELVGADGRRRAENFTQGGGIEIAGGGDSESSVCGEDAAIAKLRMTLEGGAKAVEQIDLQSTFDAGMCETLRKGGLEGIAYSVDASTF